VSSIISTSEEVEGAVDAKLNDLLMTETKGGTASGFPRRKLGSVPVGNLQSSCVVIASIERWAEKSTLVTLGLGVNSGSSFSHRTCGKVLSSMEKGGVRETWGRIATTHSDTREIEISALSLSSSVSMVVVRLAGLPRSNSLVKCCHLLVEVLGLGGRLSKAMATMAATADRIWKPWFGAKKTTRPGVECSIERRTADMNRAAERGVGTPLEVKRRLPLVASSFRCS